MRLTFIGAAHEVTGSCHVLEAAGKTILVDYGMEQGVNIYENEPLPVSPEKIDYVFLTHSHIDHSGLLPALVKNGFEGSIFASSATSDLCDIMLQDSANIQESEAEWKNRKARRQGVPEQAPLYSVQDALETVQLFVPCDYGRVYSVSEDIRVRFQDVGHLLGSAFIEVWVTEDNKETKLVFSGDVGNIDQPLIRDPSRPDSADYVIIESTYGDRNHAARVNYIDALTDVLERTFARGGNVIIPSFAVGRTQEMLYFFRQIKEEKRVKTIPDFEVYLDSPLANRATDIFSEHTLDCFDEEARALIDKGINPILFDGLKLSVTTDDSKAINFDKTPKVILSASGMCDAGRIRHHLKHNLWRSDCTVLFVGYQSVGTLGRKIADGAKEVVLFNEKIAVAAEITTLPGVSGHADREGLLNWLSDLKMSPKKVFVVHGEDSITDEFAKAITERYGYETLAPYSGTIYDLTNDCLEKLTEGVPFKKEEHNYVDDKGEQKTVKAKESERDPQIFAALQKQGKEILDGIAGSEHLSNKEIKRRTEELAALLEKWKA